MSVSGSCEAKYYPFLPSIPPNEKRCLVGHWNGWLQITGDGSGGEYLATITIGNLQGLFPSLMRWDLQWCSFYCFQAALTWGILDIYWGDYPYSSNALRWARAFTWGGALVANWPQFTPMPAYKAGISRNTSSFVRATIGSNTNGYIFEFQAGGYVYDERYLVE